MVPKTSWETFEIPCRHVMSTLVPYAVIPQAFLSDELSDIHPPYTTTFPLENTLHNDNWQITSLVGWRRVRGTTNICFYLTIWVILEIPTPRRTESRESLNNFRSPKPLPELLNPVSLVQVVSDDASEGSEGFRPQAGLLRMLWSLKSPGSSMWAKCIAQVLLVPSLCWLDATCDFLCSDFHVLLTEWCRRCSLSLLKLPLCGDWIYSVLRVQCREQMRFVYSASTPYLGS